MPLKIFECPVCGDTKRTLKNETPICQHFSGVDEEYYRSIGCPNASEMVETIQAPEAKMLETVDKENGKTRLKDQMKILKERSRIHARDYEADDLIQKNKDNGIERIGFLKSDGTKRTKIDDL